MRVTVAAAAARSTHRAAGGAVDLTGQETRQALS